jgi:hypothetical protein
MSGVVPPVPHMSSGHGQRRLDLSTYTASCNAYRESFIHVGPYALLFSEALTMICLPEVQVFSHENRYDLQSGSGRERQLFMTSNRFNPAKNSLLMY